MADSERALGRLDRALALLREADLSAVDRATQIEMLIVESGVRRDQGLADAAVVVLQVPELKSTRLHPWSARLFYAYADALLGADREQEARNMFARAAAADPEGETDAADRLNELDGVFFADSDDEDLDGEDGDDEDDLDGEDSDDDEAVEDEAELEELDAESEDEDAEGAPSELDRARWPSAGSGRPGETMAPSFTHSRPASRTVL
jgi:hypothetical protein